jgi:hypothetical protein
MVSRLLDREDWRNVHTVAFVAVGRLYEGRLLSSAGWEPYSSQKGGCYVFRNHHHPLREDKRYNIVYP